MPLMSLAVLLLILDLVALWFALNGAPFVPTKTAGVEKILECCEVVPGMKAADIGAGDGRIVIALAKAGAEAHGYEINPLLVWIARRKIRKAGLEGKAFIHCQDMWRVDYSQYRAVTLFGTYHIMRRLERKLRRELKPGARTVSLAFEFPKWRFTRKLANVFVYVQDAA